MAVAQAVVHKEAVEPSIYTFPFLVVLAYLFVEFGRPQDWVGPLKALHLGALVLGGGVLALLRYRPSSIPRQAKYILAYLIAMAISIPFAENNFHAFMATKDFAIFFFGAVLPVMIFVDSSRKVNVLFRFWVGIHILLALYSIRHRGLGVGSFLEDENDFGLAINMVIPYAFFMLFIARSTFEKFFFLGSLVIFLAATIATFSRGGFLGLLAVGFFCWFFTPKKVITTFIILVLCGSFLIVTDASYWTEMSTIQTADQEGDTGHQRLYLWGLAWQLFLDHPILGVGPANYQYNAYIYETQHETGQGLHVWGKVAHSLYFTLLSEGGLVGVILFLLILMSARRDRKRIRSYFKRDLLISNVPEAKQEELKAIYYLSLAVDASLIGFLVSGAFITVVYYPHFWLLTAFSAILKKVFDRTLSEAVPASSRAGLASFQAAQTV